MSPSNAMVIQFQIPVMVMQEEDGYVMSFLPLNAHGQGRTEGEAMKSFKQAFQAVVEICLENGTLEKILREAGFAVASTVPQTAQLRPPAKAKNKGEPHWRHVNVPIPLVMTHAFA